MGVGMVGVAGSFLCLFLYFFVYSSSLCFSKFFSVIIDKEKLCRHRDVLLFKKVGGKKKVLQS